MPPERDWRAPPDEAGSDALAYSDIALGYLSRNPAYRADYTGHGAAGVARSRRRHRAMTTKTPFSVYLDPELMQALAAYADRRGKSRSLVAEAAIASFLSPDADEQREAAIAKRLDRLDRRQTRLERDVGIGVEMIALFVRFWLSNTPAPPEMERASMRRQGGDRYDAFIEALGRRLAKGPKVRQEIGEDVEASSKKAGQLDGLDR